MKKENLTNLILGLIILLFGILYVNMIIGLPLFGDSALHASNTRSILYGNLLETKLDYPPLFFIFQGILSLLFGEYSMQILTLIGVLLIAASTFLLAKEITKNPPIALISMILVLASTKLIFYSARMYMEILLSGLFIFTIFILMRCSKKGIDNKGIILIALLSGVTASIKQQGLFILFPSILIFLIVKEIVTKKENKLTGMITLKFLFIFLLIILLPYFVLAHNSGYISPGIGEFASGNITNTFMGKIAGYNEDNNTLLFDEKWGPKISQLEKDNLKIATERSEERHIWPWEPFISWNKFVQSNSLYIQDFWSTYTPKYLEILFNLLLIFGFFLFFFNVLREDTRKEYKLDFLVFLIIFLLINYLLFFRNADQMKYHLFIPLILSLFSAIGIFTIYKFLFLRGNNTVIFTALLVFLVIISLVPLAYEDTNMNKNRWEKTQIYSPSIGGIQSISEVGDWLNQNTDKHQKVFQVCGSELIFYSQREVIGSYAYYFINSSELKEIFKDAGISHLVFFDSQVVPDNQWNNFCWVPQSFNEMISKNFKEIYTSSFGDIHVYNITNYLN